MADAFDIPIRVKRTLGSVPPPDGLEFGELAFSDENNTLYLGKSDGTIASIVLSVPEPEPPEPGPFTLASLGAKLVHNWDLTDASQLTIATGIAEVSDQGAGDVSLVQPAASRQPAFSGGRAVFNGTSHGLEAAAPISSLGSTLFLVFEDVRVDPVGLPWGPRDASGNYPIVYDGTTSTAISAGFTAAELNKTPVAGLTRAQVANLITDSAGPKLLTASRSTDFALLFGFSCYSSYRSDLLIQGNFYQALILGPTATTEDKANVESFLAAKHGVVLA